MCEEEVSKKPYLKLLSASKIDNLSENQSKLDSPHLLSDRTQLNTENVLERLIRRNQAYKGELIHALNLKDYDFKLLYQINKTDFGQKWTDQNASFDVELSFTWLDWRILELIVSDEIFNVENVDTEQAL